MVDYNRMIPCTQCPCMMKLTQGKYGYFYECVCGLVHGCHQSNGDPFGFPVNKETRQLRSRLHLIFDFWYKELGLSKRQGYKRLSRIMKLPMYQTHIGLFDKDQCQYLIDILTNKDKIVC